MSIQITLHPYLTGPLIYGRFILQLFFLLKIQTINKIVILLDKYSNKLGVINNISSELILGFFFLYLFNLLALARARIYEFLIALINRNLFMARRHNV